MRPVVREWDAAMRAALPAYARLVPEAEKRGSVLRPPAREDEIAAVEASLDVALPPSYRSFLLISNGADAGNLGAGHVERLSRLHRVELLGVHDLSVLGEPLSWLVPIWHDMADADAADHQDLPSADAPVDIYNFEPGLRAVLITLGEQDQTVGLVPFPGEWQVWDFGHSEVTGYESFASFLQCGARRAREHVAERAARLEGAGVIESERRGLQYCLLVALDSCGDPEIVDELETLIATGPPALAGLVAQHLEARDDLPRW
jgi:SMI1 / KNR4 family (SUKH-1)